MTKRKRIPTYRWLNLGLVAVGITAALGGVHFLQWQEASVVLTTPSQLQPATATGHTAIELPTPLDLQGALQRSEAVVVELAPVPTVAAPGNPPLPRPVARTRSSR